MYQQECSAATDVKRYDALARLLVVTRDDVTALMLTAGLWTRLLLMTTADVSPLYVLLHQEAGTEWKQQRWETQVRGPGHHSDQPLWGSQNARSFGVCNPHNWQPGVQMKTRGNLGQGLQQEHEAASGADNPLPFQFQNWKLDQPGMGACQKNPVDLVTKPTKILRSECLCMSHPCELNPLKMQKKQRSLGNVALWAAHPQLGYSNVMMSAHPCQLARLPSFAYLHLRLLREWQPAFLYSCPIVVFLQHGPYCGENVSHPTAPEKPQSKEKMKHVHITYIILYVHGLMLIAHWRTDELMMPNTLWPRFYAKRFCLVSKVKVYTDK